MANYCGPALNIFTNIKVSRRSHNELIFVLFSPYYSNASNKIAVFSILKIEIKFKFQLCLQLEIFSLKRYFIKYYLI